MRSSGAGRLVVGTAVVMSALLLVAACGESSDGSRVGAGGELSPVEVAAKQGWGHLYAASPVAVRGLGVARGSTAAIGFGRRVDDKPVFDAAVQGSTIVERDAVSGRERRRRIAGGGYWELYAGVSDGKSVAYLVRRCNEVFWLDGLKCVEEHFTVDVGPVDGDVLSVSMPLPQHSYKGVALRDGMVAALYAKYAADKSTGMPSVVTSGVVWSEVGSPPRWSELAPLDSPMSFGSNPCATGDGVVWAREGLPDGNVRLRRFELGSEGWGLPVGPVLGVRSLVACGPDQAYVSVPESNSLWRLSSESGAEPEMLEQPGEALTRGEGGSLFDMVCVDAVDGTLYMGWRPSFGGDDATTLWPRDSTTPTRTVPHLVNCPVADGMTWTSPTDDPPTLKGEPL